MQVIYALFDFNKKICYNLFGGTFLSINMAIGSSAFNWQWAHMSAVKFFIKNILST